MINRHNTFTFPAITTVSIAISCLLIISMLFLYQNIWASAAKIEDLNNKVSNLTQKMETLKNHSDPLVQPPNSKIIVPAISDDMPGYTRLYPEMYGPGFDEAQEDKRENILYLTFDDGPSENTIPVLDILDQYCIKATFFVVVNEASHYIPILQEIVRRGHTIGIHSNSHDYKKIYGGVEAFLEDFHKAYEIVYQETGCRPELFRFPGGSNNGYLSDTFQEIVTEMSRRGFLYYDWNVSAQDAKNGITAEEVRCNVMSSLGQRTRGVVLMHDSSPRETTREALPQIIKELRDRGFQFDRLTNQVRPVQFKMP